MREGASPGNGAGKLFRRYGFVLIFIQTGNRNPATSSWHENLPSMIIGISDERELAALAVCVECLFVRSPCVLVVYFLRTPSRVPYGTPSACANRAAYPDSPPVVPHPESIDAQAAYRGRHSVTVVPKLEHQTCECHP